jgi:hypothetical protein
MSTDGGIAGFIHMRTSSSFFPFQIRKATAGLLYLFQTGNSRILLELMGRTARLNHTVDPEQQGEGGPPAVRPEMVRVQC